MSCRTEYPCQHAARGETCPSVGDVIEPPDYWRCSCTPVVGLAGLRHSGARCTVDGECLLCDGHAGPCDPEPYT